MYLKSIEIHGFKSFANKILLKFNDGITAIVGPNGSGKSNVADAVRWVLGEQSAKQLRGNKMEDVIFSGTVLRKPMGYAYVAITFDNSDRALNLDYEEVTVARRVYRSGDSEYLLNGNECRLRDVQELFFDTGIGKEGYSIIGQGQIDRILSNKPEDRRELFDEAAGIVKYKKRKAAAEKELDEERLNLSRITDILSEIEKQVGPLEKQSETAKEYLKLKEQLKNLEINQFLFDYEKLTQQRDESSEKKSIIENDILMAQKEFEDTKKRYSELEEQITSLTEEIDLKKDEKNELALENEKSEGQIKILEERKKALYASNAHYEGRKTDILAEIERKNEEIQKQQVSREDNQQKIDALNRNAESSNDELNEINERIQAATREIEQINEFLMNLLNEDAGYKEEISKYKTLIEQNSIKKAELTKKLLSGQNFEQEYETAVETYDRELDEAEQEIERIRSSVFSKEAESAKLKERLEETESFLQKFQKEEIELRSKVGALKDISERYEGYGNAVKAVMEQKNKYPGIIGVVSDIIEVPQKYETAIEIALGGSIQNIVTKDEATAKRMVEFLKDNKAGRATFLPLNAITAKDANESPSVLRGEGVIGYANKLVKYSKEFSEVVKYLIGRIIVVDNMNNALKLARANNYSLRIVTLEGESLNPGGSISGGAFKKDSNFLGRKRETEEAEEKVKSLTVKVNALSRERDTFKEKRDKLKAEIQKENEELQKLSIKQNTLRMKLTQEEERLKENKEAFSVYELEIHELDEKNVKNNSEISRINELVQANEQSRKLANEKQEELNNRLDEERRLERYSNEKGASLKAENAGLLSAISFIDETIERFKEDIRKLEEEISSLEENVALSESQLSEIDQNTSDEHDNISNRKIHIASLDEKLHILEDQKSAITRDHKDYLDKREQLSTQLADLDKESFKLDNQLIRMNDVINEQCNHMWDEYQLTVELCREKKDDTLGSYTSIKKNALETRSSIRALGDVNVNAIEQYKEVSERYKLYTTQKADLVEAENKLLGIISTLEDEMRKQFQEKFAIIKDEFDVVFKEMFGGGQGSLELMEDEDVLTAGIKINAQPPGKKLQNMMMLSGGERALTAIALLFAIQNLKPSPFCLLDEIEAALDDNNVGRYAKYLHKLTSHTQFIVITHRRGTMASADALYGITMQEKGVSALVSVSLIEDALSN